MTLAIMSPQQWITAHKFRDFRVAALNTILSTLSSTLVYVLLIIEDKDRAEYSEFEKFIFSVLGDSHQSVIRIMHVSDINTLSSDDFISDSESIVSFLPISRGNNRSCYFIFHNPGQNLEHYETWFRSQQAMNPYNDVIVMDLATLVQQDRRKVSVASPMKNLCALGYSTGITSAPKTIIDPQKNEEHGTIYGFKKGATPVDLNQHLVQEINACLQEENMTDEEFDVTGQPTNFDFSQIKYQLQAVQSEFLRDRGYNFKLISSINPQDMQKLGFALKSHDADYAVKNDQVIELAGVPLSCGFVNKENTLAMIKKIIQPSYAPSLWQNPQHRTYFVTSEPSHSSNAELRTIRKHFPTLIILYGWDGSPVHDWVLAHRPARGPSCVPQP